MGAETRGRSSTCIMVTSAERPLNHSVYAARCNDARRYNAPTSPPGGRMPLVRAILQRIATVSGPLQPTEKSGLGKLCSKTGSPRFAWMKARDEILFFLIFGGGDSYIVYPFRFIMEFMTFTLCPVRFIYFILKILRAICVRLFGIEET